MADATELPDFSGKTAKAVAKSVPPIHQDDVLTFSAQVIALTISSALNTPSVNNYSNQRHSAFRIFPRNDKNRIALINRVLDKRIFWYVVVVDIRRNDNEGALQHSFSNRFVLNQLH